MESEVKRKLKECGYEENREEIEAQVKVALEAYTAPGSEERKIVTAQKGGLHAPGTLQTPRPEDGRERK